MENLIQDKIAANTAKPVNGINGWGMDADPENDPTYPMRDRSKEEEKGYTWERPEQQPATVEVLHSNERPNLSAVFGTTSPPSGLSGMIRRMAFKYSEGSWGHWIPLIMADRVNEIEGIVEDIAKGKIPNFFAEHGWPAEWKYNKKNAIKTIAVSAVVTAAVVGVVYLLFNTDKVKKAIKK
jgi:hypothetical protein